MDHSKKGPEAAISLSDPMVGLPGGGWVVRSEIVAVTIETAANISVTETHVKLYLRGGATIGVMTRSSDVATRFIDDVSSAKPHRGESDA